MAKQRLWKFLRLKDGKIVSDRDNSEWQIGVRRSVSAPTEACIGLNCCHYIVDAMRYVQGEILAEVEIQGVQIVDGDKITCEHMTLIRAWKWGKIDSVALSSYAAGLVEENFNREFPGDNRVKDCNALVRKWIEDPTSVSDDELSAAGSAAWSAGSAAWSAAWSAAPAAWSAAWSAAPAAWSAAWSAGSAAWSAAPAAWSAAWSARSAAESAGSAGSEKARRDMKKMIQKWIISRLEKMEAVS